MHRGGLIGSGNPVVCEEGEAFDGEPDPVRIGAGCDDEVVLEAARAGVIDVVDARIDVG